MCRRFVRRIGFGPQVTTTDGEQPDDSLDLIDGLPEMSPPPVLNDHSTGSNHSSASSNVPNHSDSNNATTATSRASSNNAAQQQQRTSGIGAGVNGNCTAPIIQGATNPARSSSISGSLTKGTTGTTGLLNNECMNVNGIPPPTPLVGARQESRFSFNTGRTPPLPDLRATEFFRYAIRLSLSEVDNLIDSVFGERRHFAAQRKKII